MEKIENAGLVLLAPFLPRLFDMAGLLTADRRDFGDERARITAIGLMEALLYDDHHLKSTGEGLQLKMLLTGWPQGKTLPAIDEPTAQHKEQVQSLLKDVMNYWDKMKNTSTQAFREAFLTRPGTLEEKDGHYLLTIEVRAFDILLDSLPWNFRNIRLPWMEKHIEVKWRG